MAVALMGWTLLGLHVCKEDTPLGIEVPNMVDVRPNPTLETLKEAEVEKESSAREASINGAEAVDLSREGTAISDLIHGTHGSPLSKALRL